MNKNTHRKFAAHQNNTSDIPEAGIILYILYHISFISSRFFICILQQKLHLFFSKKIIFIIFISER